MFISRTQSNPALQCDGEFQAQFTAVAPHYDRLMRGVPYDMWVEYVELLVSIEGANPKRVVDLACGTGNVTFALAKRGYDVTGVDLSCEMIAAAQEKAKPLEAEFPDLTVEFSCQDLRALSLPQEYELAVCLFDSLNYLLWEEQLESAFRNILRCVVPEGLFIFDMNSDFALEEEFFTQDNLFRDEDLRYNWISHFDTKTRIAEVEMYFEAENGKRAPLRFKEKHYERAYSMQQVQSLLTNAGWDCLKTYDAYTTTRPRPRSERWYFVCAPTRRG